MPSENSMGIATQFLHHHSAAGEWRTKKGGGKTRRQYRTPSPMSGPLFTGKLLH
jgi:hypothetical protein